MQKKVNGLQELLHFKEELEILGLNNEISYNEVTRIINSEQYKNKKIIFKSRIKRIINELTDKIRNYYPYMPSIQELENSVKEKKDFHPQWLTSKELINSVNKFLNSDDVIEIRDEGINIIRNLRAFHEIVLNWDYCNNMNCNNFKEFIINKDGFKVCAYCGTTLERIIVQHKTRAYNKDEINKREIREVKPITGYRTIINTYDLEKVEPRNRTLMWRLSRIQRNSDINEARRLIAEPILKYFEESFGKNNYETAKRIFYEAVKKRVTVGRSINDVIMASYYLALRVNGCPRFLSDIIKEFKVVNDKINMKKITMYSKVIEEKGVLRELNYNIKPVNIKEYTHYYLSQIGITGDLYNQIMELIDNYKTHKSKKKSGIIATAMYIVLKNNDSIKVARILRTLNKQLGTKSKRITQKLIAKYMNLSTETLKENIKFFCGGRDSNP